MPASDCNAKRVGQLVTYIDQLEVRRLDRVGTYLKKYLDAFAVRQNFCQPNVRGAS